MENASASVPGHGSSDNRLARWRSNVVFLVMFWAFSAALCVGAAALAVTTPIGLGDLAIIALLLLDVGWMSYVNTAHVDLYANRVVIGGWLRANREVPLAQLLSVEPSRSGLFFRTGKYDGVLGPGLIGPKGDLLKALRLRNRGDRIAATIMQAAKRSMPAADADN